MAVAKTHVAELYEILSLQLTTPKPSVQALLSNLKKTAAYKQNTSFRQTINRLDAYGKER